MESRSLCKSVSQGGATVILHVHHHIMCRENEGGGRTSRSPGSLLPYMLSHTEQVEAGLRSRSGDKP